MDEILKYLNAGGSLGVFILLYMAWRIHDRMKDMEWDLRSHKDADAAEHKRINKRLDKLESQHG